MAFPTRTRLLIALGALLATAGSALAADYYVSPQGRNTNAGTKAQPFATLAKAGEAAGAGDTVYLRAGTYRETLKPQRSGEAGKPVRFVAAPGEKAVISGADALTGTWQQHQGSVYKLTTARKFVQLFVDGQMMPEARWPNSPPGDMMTYKRGVAGAGTGYETLADASLPPGDWNGALVLLWPGSRWVSAMRGVTDYQPGKSFRFDQTLEAKTKDKFHTSDPYKPTAGNPYLLFGSLAGLDSPGEWFLDKASGTVYLWAPGGDDPARHVVEVKQRDYAFDLSKQGFIEIKGVEVLGAAANLTDAHDCLLEDCRLRFVEHYGAWDQYKLPAPLNVVTGTNNELRRCLISYAATCALRLAGADNRLVDCVIHDANYLGTGRGGVELTNSIGAQVVHCSIFRAGRDTIQHHGSKRIRLEYNDIYHTNMLNADSGAVYCWGTDGEGGIIAYNWVHDNLGDSTVGIYLDNFSKNFIVHHNVIWNCTGSGVRLNCDALNHQVYNNTITQVREPFGTFTYSAYKPTMQGTRIINNLVNAEMRRRDPSQFVQGELGPEVSHNGPGAVDREAYPVAGSAAIDAGIAIPGITDGFKGKAPDLGAYEFAGERWIAGADWRDPDAPPPPPKDLTYSPRGPVTEKTMIRDGLLVWLDAADAATLDVGPGGGVQAWRDKSPGKHIALPINPARPVTLVDDGLNHLPVVRGDGTGALRISDLQRGPGAVTAFIVSQAPQAAGPSWQRLIACFTGEGQEWVLPNWNIVRVGGEKPEAYPAQIFTVQQRAGAAMGKLTVLGASASDGQCLAGDVAEVLVFGRILRFDEFDAVKQYLSAKWGVTD
jgi:hypothetical protein